MSVCTCTDPRTTTTTSVCLFVYNTIVYCVGLCMYMYIVFGFVFCVYTCMCMLDFLTVDIIVIINTPKTMFKNINDRNKM